MAEPVETTQQLIELIRDGDRSAQDRLMRRYLPLMTRWAHGKLPGFARDLNDTADLVQLTLLRAFNHLPSFEVQGKGAFFGFLRTVLNNILRDEVRRGSRQPGKGELNDELVDPDQNALGLTLSMEVLEAYERALQAMDDSTRELIIMRIELGFSHEDIARVTQAPSVNAARMRVARAIASLAETMKPFE